MFFADYHCHTRLSPDGRRDADYLSMAEAAAKAGLGELCITDHCECNGFCFSPTQNIGFTYNRAVCRLRLEEARARMGGRIVLPWGVELGQATQVPERAAEVLADEDYDFIIGSLHNIRGQLDFCMVPYESAAHCDALLGAYLDELEEMIDAVPFDVVGHVEYPLRYMRRRFPEVSFAGHEERLRAVLRKAAERGKGIEINTKALRGAQAVDTEQPYLLRLWREEGGTLLTLGSDAHNPDDVGAGLRTARAMAEAAGLPGTAVWRRHVPEIRPF